MFARDGVFLGSLEAGPFQPEGSCVGLGSMVYLLHAPAIARRDRECVPPMPTQDCQSKGFDRVAMPWKAVQAGRRMNLKPHTGEVP